MRPPHRPLTIDSRRIVHDLFSVRNMFSLGLRDNSGEFSMTAVLTCVTNFPNSLPDSVRYSTQQFGRNVIGPAMVPIGRGIDRSGTSIVERCDAYRRFAAQCVELARHMDSSYDRTVLLEMALLWSRLAQYAAKIATPEELSETP